CARIQRLRVRDGRGWSEILGWRRSGDREWGSRRPAGGIEQARVDPRRADRNFQTDC
ncbi:MAG: hypothetical protein AVDCRST_MAG68-2989, partial [uncultured Gemmatimonadetes bacterium]